MALIHGACGHEQPHGRTHPDQPYNCRRPPDTNAQSHGGKVPILIDRTLEDIARSHGTDKEGAHSYTSAYAHHLAHLRNQAITLLEIGVGGYAEPTAGGASLRMWKEYFASGRIIGLDIADKSPLAEERITIVQGDQGDPVLLDRLAREHGPFDVVIDDGSHHCRHVVTSFTALFPHLAEHGIYVIEDLQTSYWETYGGSSGEDRRGTTMELLHALADGLNYAEFDIPFYEPTYTDRWVSSVTFYHNIAFIHKGPNVEPSHLLPPHPRPTRRFARPAQVPPRRSHTVRTWVRTVVPLRLRRAGRALGRSARSLLRPTQRSPRG